VTPLVERLRAALLAAGLPVERVVRDESTKRLLAEKCECCGTTGTPLQAHHTNKLANLKQRWRGRQQKPEWVKWMISRHRKTIFVCPPCHQDITYGRYDGAKLC
jgi:hypothetical protein